MKISYWYWQVVAIVFVLVGVALMLSGTGQAQAQSVSPFDRANPVLYARAQAAQSSPSSPVKQDEPKAEPVKPAKESSKFTATAEEDKDLRIGQLDAQLAQTQFSQDSQRLPSFAAFQQKLQSLQAECNRVIAKHKWPTGVVCDIQTIPIKFCTVPAGTQSGPSPCSAAASASTPAPAK